jgi:ABC-type glycerol-3-phosphate transport system substrate-binding protein
VPEADYLFAQGQAAVTLSGPWLAFSPATGRAPHLLEKVGITFPPGIPCSLGSHLVIWNYVPPRQEKMALELLRFLTGQEVQHTGSQLLGLLPSRLSVLSTPPFADDPHYQAFVGGLQSSRSFPVMRLWGLVEEQLSAAFGKLWATILATPNPDLDTLIRAELEPLAERLNRRLQ